MSNPGGFEIAVKIDDRQLRAAVKMLQDAQRQLQGAIPPQARQQMREVNSMMSGGQVQVQQVNKQMGTLQRMRDELKSISKNSLALVGIGAGIAGIFALMKQVSPIFSSTFQLLLTSITLFLRPIADFVGLIFRPVMVELLRKVILPYNEYVTPFLRDQVGPISKMIVDFFNDPLGLEGRPIPGLGGLDTGVDAMTAGIADFAASIADVQLNFKTNWDSVRQFFDRVGNDASNILGGAWNQIIGFFSNAGKAALGELQSAWGNVSSFFQGLVNSISFSLDEAWRNVVGFFNDLRLAATGTLLGAWETVKGFFAGISESISSTLKPAWDGIKTVGQNIKSALESVWGAIVEAYNNIVRQIPFAEAFGLKAIPTPEEPAPQQPASSGGRRGGRRVVRVGSPTGAGSGFTPGLGSRGGAAAQRPNARGGIINEFVFGVGKSGKTYSFGEEAPAVPEMVTPIRGGAGAFRMPTRPIEIHFHNVNIYNQADIHKIANDIKRILQQGNSRGGTI